MHEQGREATIAKISRRKPVKERIDNRLRQLNGPAREGPKVVCTEVNREGDEASIDKVPEAGAGVEFALVVVTDDKQVQALIAQLAALNRAKGPQGGARRVRERLPWLLRTE